MTTGTLPYQNTRVSSRLGGPDQSNYTVNHWYVSGTTNSPTRTSRSAATFTDSAATWSCINANRCYPLRSAISAMFHL